MSTTVNLSNLSNSSALSGTSLTKGVAKAKDALFEPYNSAYGETNSKELPMEVKDYLLQIKSYSDALSSSLTTLMLRAVNENDSETASSEADTDVRAEARNLAESPRQTESPKQAEPRKQTESRNRVKEVSTAVQHNDKETSVARVKDSMRKLTESYNALLEFSGDFEKDPGFEKLNNRLRTLVDTYRKTLEEAGINVTKDGTLELDDERLDQAIDSGRVEGLFSDTENTGFAKSLETISEKGVSSPSSYMNDNTPHRAGGDKSGREYLKIMDTYSTKGMVFDTVQ